MLVSTFLRTFSSRIRVTTQKTCKSRLLVSNQRAYVVVVHMYMADTQVTLPYTHEYSEASLAARARNAQRGRPLLPDMARSSNRQRYTRQYTCTCTVVYICCLRPARKGKREPFGEHLFSFRGCLIWHRESWFALFLQICSVIEVLLWRNQSLFSGISPMWGW